MFFEKIKMYSTWIATSLLLLTFMQLFVIIGVLSTNSADGVLQAMQINFPTWFYTYRVVISNISLALLCSGILFYCRRNGYKELSPTIIFFILYFIFASILAYIM